MVFGHLLVLSYIGNLASTLYAIFWWLAVLVSLAGLVHDKIMADDLSVTMARFTYL